jgi:23S rRNA (adenine-N6)-dimethyltransferase
VSAAKRSKAAGRSNAASRSNAAGRSNPAESSYRPWGWHRLSDEWAARVVAAAAVRPGELVLDIGAGTGALTKHLIRAGARVVAVELHPGRIAVLQRRFPEVTVIHANALDLRLPNRPFRVVANPPYGITADLIGLLLAAGSRLTAADLVLQRAVVRKYSACPAGPPRWARTYRIQAGFTVPRHAFSPPPRVDSAVLVVRHR